MGEALGAGMAWGGARNASVSEPATVPIAGTVLSSPKPWGPTRNTSLANTGASGKYDRPRKATDAVTNSSQRTDFVFQA